METFNTINDELAAIDAELQRLDNTRYEQTELGNAKRFRDGFLGQLLYVPENMQWFFWNDKLWKPDDDGKAIRFFETVIGEWKADLNQLLATYSKLADDSDEKKAMKHEVTSLVHWIKTCQRLATIKNSLTLAASQENMTASLSQFDSKGHFFGVDNGIIDLRSGALITGDSSYMITKRSPVKFNPEAKAPAWDAFLAEIMMGKTENVAFLQRVIGQAMFGTQGKDKLLIAWGTGANGKSTMMDTIRMVLGDYAANTDPSILLADNRQNKEYYMAPLKGVRLVLMSETKSGDMLAEALIKKVLDSGEVTARYPAGRVFEYQPVFTPILSTNRKPKVGSDPAIWRRILMLPFTYTIPQDKRNARFRSEVLAPEAEGILNWCLEGAREYQRIGLSPPDDVIAATEAYKSDQDKLGMFIRESCKTGPTLRMTLKDLQAEYAQWCLSQSLKPLGPVALKDELIAHGIEVRISTGGINYVFGLAVDRLSMGDIKDMIAARRANPALALVEFDG